MGAILRTTNQTQNPTLPGGIYGPWISEGVPVFFIYKGGQTHFIILISDGGRYGMADLTLAEYKSIPLTEYRFHRGTFTKQIAPVPISSFNTGSDVITTTTAHGLANGDLVRFGVSEGALPTDISTDSKYLIADATSTTFKIKNEAGTVYIDISNDGSGYMLIWKADAGFDDPEQGALQYCPEFNSTFNNIALVEGRLDAGHSHPTNPPDWADFRFGGHGRRLMDYDADGNELGVILGETDEEKELLSLVPLHVIDNYIVSYKGKLDRIDFPTWRVLREAAEVKIWQRIKTDITGTTHGLVSRYYQTQDFTDLVLTRIDLEINFPHTSGSVSPAPGVLGTGFSIISTGKIKFEFSEVYTLTFVLDDAVDFYLDGMLILTATSVGTHSVDITATANQISQIEIRYRNLYFPLPDSYYTLQFKWQSASQPLEIVPSDWLYPSDEKVSRYGDVGIAFPYPTEASEVHERLMERMPGYDWTDSDRKIVFLPPDRPIVFPFRFDRVDDDSKPNFVSGSFVKKRRPLADKRNFKLGRGRDALKDGYPIFYVQVERDALRELANGEPSNDAASELGVCTNSLATRMMEMELVLKSDPPHTFNISGVRGSSIIRKNQFITIFYIDFNGNYVADSKAIVTSHTWGAKNSKNDFVALPIIGTFYTDEEATG